MLEKNHIYQCDVLDGLRQLDDESVDLIITSPPYNKAGLNGVRKLDRGIKDVWHHNIKYNCDANNDNMPEDQYQDWQVEILNECYRVLKADGSLFYNHKNRSVYGKGYVISPLQWILRSPFRLRQEIIWLRCGSPSLHRCRFLQDTEKIFWLTKQVKPRFNIDWKNGQFRGEVWRLCPDKNTGHPAPFPIAIPDNIIPNVLRGGDGNLLVLDPFMGSGTVALSALKNGCDYIGFEKFQMYVDMAENRIKTLTDAMAS